jgi:hypothetical protein
VPMAPMSKILRLIAYDLNNRIIIIPFNEYYSSAFSHHVWASSLSSSVAATPT